MGLFKDPKKPVIRQAARGGADISPLRPKLAAKTAPCIERCPAGIDVRGWLTVIAQADAYGRPGAEAFELAWSIVADANPFPATLGRICPHPCQHGCHRAGKDGAVGVNALERTLGDVALSRGFLLPSPPQPNDGRRVAVVGGGAAGLSCAYQLARRGHGVTVFEAGDRAGGRLRDAIPSGRIAAAVVDAEIARVLALGIELRCNATVKDDLANVDEAYDAIVIAAGRKWRGARSATVGAGHARQVFVVGDALERGLVGAAIASGRRVAEGIHAAFSGDAASSPPSSALSVVRAERLKLDWYEPAEQGEWTKTIAADAQDVSAAGITESQVVAEARRCMSCGLCMDCERCWMFCTSNCFEKLPKGQHYRVKPDTCNGCRKCADECPCGYIEMI